MKDITQLLPLPIVASSHGQEIDMMIYMVHIIMLILFVGWGIFFIYCLVRFNKRLHPQATYTGLHSHASTVVEIAVVVIEAVLLIGFSIPFWAKQVNALPVNRPDKLEIKVLAEQFAWNIHYPGADGIFGKTALEFYDKQSNPLGLDPNDKNGKDDIATINQLHIPIGHPVIIHLSSRDVIHSFGIPVMRVKQDVIPGISIPTWFTPTKTGQWEIVCGQLCGIGHYRMKGFITVHTDEDYKKWLKDNAPASTEAGGSSDAFWN